MNSRDAVWVAVYRLLNEQEEFTRTDVMERIETDTGASTVERVLETMTARNVLEVESSHPRKWSRGEWADEHLTPDATS